MRTSNYWKRALLFAAICVAARAQTFTVIKRFSGTGGKGPFAPLVQGVDGDFYGTTVGGGAELNGTVFKITASGNLTTIHDFCSAGACLDGSSPVAALIRGLDGRFYSTTSDGGQHAGGAVFAITPQGRLTTLVSFCKAVSCADGADPRSALVQASDGTLYGTTQTGGANGDHGTIFRLKTNGDGLKTLHNFCALTDCADGELPQAGLIQGMDGNFYGATSSSGVNGHGTIFKMTPAGRLTTLYSFCVSTGCPDGDSPLAAVVQDSAGNLYGVTAFGGFIGPCASGCGTVFKLTPQGTLATLYRFSSFDGALPVGLLQATDGNFYGTTQLGGTHNQGTVFQVTAGGTLTTLHSFSMTDGTQPQAGLMQATDGSFYGTTAQGALGNRGSIFRLDNGLGPFVETFPVAAAAGQAVQIQGTHLTGTTNVIFNGVPTQFTVGLDTLIDCVVPSGASHGLCAGDYAARNTDQQRGLPGAPLRGWLGSVRKTGTSLPAGGKTNPIANCVAAADLSHLWHPRTSLPPSSENSPRNFG